MEVVEEIFVDSLLWMINKIQHNSDLLERKNSKDDIKTETRWSIAWRWFVMICNCLISYLQYHTQNFLFRDRVIPLYIDESGDNGNMLKCVYESEIGGSKQSIYFEDI